MSHLTPAVTSGTAGSLNMLSFHNLTTIDKFRLKEKRFLKEYNVHVARNINGSKLPDMFIHDLCVEELVASRIQPGDKRNKCEF